MWPHRFMKGRWLMQAVKSESSLPKLLQMFYNYMLFLYWLIVYFSWNLFLKSEATILVTLYILDNIVTYFVRKEFRVMWIINEYNYTIKKTLFFRNIFTNNSISLLEFFMLFQTYCYFSLGVKEFESTLDLLAVPILIY